jgi:OFA family oxalate/formate antiporter-like MFS transporter
MQACLGATYSWSIFVDYIRHATGVGQASAQRPFTLFYIVFPAMTILSGTLLGRLGPRRCAMLGGLVFGGGWILAGFGQHHFAFTLVGVGVLGGIGVGLAYIVPIAVGVLWFPRHKGLVTGLAVAGFGGGAAAVSQAAKLLLASQGATPFDALRTLGMLFAVVVVLAGACMCDPPGHRRSRATMARVGEFLRDPVFISLYLAMFAGLAAGLTVNANLKQLCRVIDVAGGARAVALFALANAAGRICWGLLFDRVRPLTAIRFDLTAQAVLLGISPFLLKSSAGLQVLALVAGFNYGGVLVLYASSVARRWGGERVGQVYGWLFSANIPAALFPWLAGAAFDVWHSFTAPLLALSVMVAVAAVCVRLDTQDGPYGSAG